MTTVRFPQAILSSSPFFFPFRRCVASTVSSFSRRWSACSSLFFSSFVIFTCYSCRKSLNWFKHRRLCARIQPSPFTPRWPATRRKDRRHGHDPGVSKPCGLFSLLAFCDHLISSPTPIAPLNKVRNAPPKKKGKKDAEGG